MLHRDKNDNEEIFEVIEHCNEAICNHKQITFLYYEYDVNKIKYFGITGSGMFSVLTV